MSRTQLAIFVAAGLAILFVFARFLGFDSQEEVFPTKGNSFNEDTSEFGSWIGFTPENDTYTVLFPRQPEHLSENLRDPLNRNLKHYEIYAANGLDNATYMVQEITFHQGIQPDKDPNALKNALADILATTRTNLLQKTEDETFLKRKSLKFEIDNDSRQILGVMFLDGQVLYILLRMAKMENAEDREDFDFFLNSFNLHKQQVKAKDPS